MLSRRRIVVGKVEGAEGVMEALVVGDAGILAIDPKFDADFKMHERTNQLNSLSPLAPIPGARSAKITFKAEVKGAGAAYSALIKPALSPFLRACGFAETVDLTAGAEKVTYLPASSGVPTLTIFVYEDGMIKKARGCRGNVKFSGKMGEPVMAEFDFTGVYDSAVDGAMLSPTFEATIPPLLLGNVLTLDAYAMIAESISFDMGNALQLRPSISAPDGYLSALLTARKPVGKLDPEMVTVATYDFFGKWKAGAAAALVLGPIGPDDAYNKFTITAPKVVYSKVGEGDRAGNMTADLDFTLSRNTGDDEIKLEFVK